MLACMNSMDSGALIFAKTFWMDLFVWAAGAVFLNRVVLANVRGAGAAQPPSWFRRIFFLAVAACLVLLLAIVTAAGPLLGISSERLAVCTINATSLFFILTAPAALFTLQALFFQGFHKHIFNERQTLAMGALLLSSVVLVLALSVVKDSRVLPQLCAMPHPGNVSFGADARY